MPTLYLIRHAEPANHGNSDAERPLTPRGRKQAQWMARFLRDKNIRELRTAPHLRCRETAELIGEALGIAPRVDPALHIARSFLVEPPAHNAVWVAHSNNIPDAVEALGANCNACGHASAWALELDETGQLVSATYTNPVVA